MTDIKKFLKERVENEKVAQILEKFEVYAEHILEANIHTNLTAIREKEEFYSKHILDSLLAFDLIGEEKGEKIIDIGTGAGFPGVPLAIVFPEKEFILLDSLRKKLKIVEEGLRKSQISNAKIFHGRAEDMGRSKETRESFDIAISRAVAAVPVLVELSLPLIEVGGKVIAYKGPDAEREIELAKGAIEKLGGAVENIIKPKTPIIINGEELQHVMVVIRKEKNTPKKYPRKAGDPAKKPL